MELQRQDKHPLLQQGYGFPRVISGRLKCSEALGMGGFFIKPYCGPHLPMAQISEMVTMLNPKTILVAHADGRLVFPGTSQQIIFSYLLILQGTVTFCQRKAILTTPGPEVLPGRAGQVPHQAGQPLRSLPGCCSEVLDPQPY